MEDCKTQTWDAQCPPSWNENLPGYVAQSSEHLVSDNGESAKASRLLIALAEVIRTRRKSINMSQQALAEAASLDRSYLISVEHGKRNPSIITIARIAETLKLTLTEFFTLVSVEMDNAE